MPFDDPMEEEAEDPNQPDLQSAVDELLQKSFDEALRDFPALKEHISSQEDAKDVEEEFRHSWHPEAPEALRQVLEELMDPRAAAANSKETADFMARMAGVDMAGGSVASALPT